MDNPGESPTDKGGEPAESEDMRTTPGIPATADTEGIPEETDGDGDADLKEAAAEESEVGACCGSGWRSTRVASWRP